MNDLVLNHLVISYIVERIFPLNPIFLWFDYRWLMYLFALLIQYLGHYYSNPKSIYKYL